MLLLVLLLATDPGFGGGEQPSPKKETQPCRIRVDGVWRECAAYMDQTQPLPVRAPAQVAERAQPRVETEAPAQAAADVEVRTDARRHTKSRTLRVLKPEGPLGDALRQNVETQEDTPLATLRHAVRALEVDLETYRSAQRKSRSDEDDARALVLAEKERVLREQTRLLDDVEVYALRLRQRCQDRLPENEDGDRPFQSPKALTVGRRLDVSEPEVRAALAELDAPQCQRTQLIAQSDIDSLARLLEAERALPDAQSYSDLKRRRALEAEIKSLSLLRTGMGLARPAMAGKKRARDLAPERFTSSGSGYKTLGGQAAPNN